MKKPILYHIYRILGCVLLVGSVLVFITGNIAGGAGVVLTGLSLIGLAEIACYLAETACNTARTAEVVEQIDRRQIAAEKRERAAALERQVNQQMPGA